MFIKKLIYLPILIFFINCGAKTGLQLYSPDAEPDEMSCEQLCDDGIFCNGQEGCGAEGECIAGQIPNCIDELECTRDWCDPETDQCRHDPLQIDSDGDNYYTSDCGGDDCDDSNYSIHPGALEMCNGVDDDCDDEIDEDALLDPWNSEIQLTDFNTTTNVNDLAWAGDGYIITWWDYRESGANIYLKKFDKEGNWISDEVKVTTSMGDALASSLCIQDEAVGVVWDDRRDGDFEIYFAIFDKDLVRHTEDTRITYAYDWSIYPKIACNDDYFAMIWQDRRTGYHEIYMQFMTIDGPRGGNIQITDEMYDCESPKIFWNGEFYGILWLQGMVGGKSLWFALVDNEGNIISRSEISLFPITGASLSATQNHWYILFEYGESGNQQIYVQKFTSSGEIDGDPIKINTTPMARMPYSLWVGGRLIAFWSGLNGDHLSLYNQILSDEAEIVRDTMIVSSSSIDSSDIRAALADGDIGIVWSDFRNDNWDIFFTRLLCSFQ